MTGVNEQHLAAMGLPSDALGKQATTPGQVSRNEPHEIQPSTANPSFCRCGIAVATHPGNVQMMPRETALPEPPVERPHTPVNPYADAVRRNQEQAAPTKQRDGDQPLPVVSNNTCVQDAVIAEMESSKRVGVERYGDVLRIFNGRSTMQDVAEEIRDLHVYVTSMRMMASATREELLSVAVGALEKQGQQPSTAVHYATAVIDAINDALFGAAMDNIVARVVEQLGGPHVVPQEEGR